MNVDVNCITIQRWWKSMYIKKRLSTLIRIYNSLCTENNFKSFMKDKRILIVVHNILSSLTTWNGYDILKPQLFMTLLYLHKYPKENLQGIHGIELLKCIVLTFNSLLNLESCINIITVAEFNRRFSVFCDMFDIWKEYDVYIYTEQVAHYIHQLQKDINTLNNKKVLTTQDHEHIVKFKQEIDKREREILYFVPPHKHDEVKTYLYTYESSLDILEHQIENAFRQSFHDKIVNDISNKEYDYVIDNILNIIDRLQELTPNNKRQQQYVQNIIDIELIKQMLNHDAFDFSNLYDIMNQIHSVFQEYHAPIDKSTYQTEFNELIEKMGLLSQSTNIDVAYSDIVIQFLETSNKQINVLQKRIQDFYNIFNKNIVD